MHGDPDALRPRTDAFTERRDWAAIGPLVTYLGLLLIIGGLLWNAVGGWRASNVALTTGRTVRPSQAEGLALTLIDAGGTSAGTTGEQRDAVVGLSLDGETRYAWLGYSRPATWGTISAAQRSSGPAVSVRAETEGRALLLQALQVGRRDERDPALAL